MTDISTFLARVFPIALLATPALVGCGSSSTSDLESPRGDRPSVLHSRATPSTETEELEFTSPAIERRFRCFEKAATEFCAKDFQRQPYGEHPGLFSSGIFSSIKWAKGCGCDDDSLVFKLQRAEWRDMHRVQLATHIPALTHISPKPCAAALRVEYLSANPQKWSVSFSYTDAEENCIFGAGWSIWFFRWQAPENLRSGPFCPTENNYIRDYVTMPQSYRFGDNGVGNASQPEFIPYARSAESFRDSYLSDLALLETKTVEFITSHQARKDGPVTGYNGVATPSLPIPLTVEEERTELQAAKAFFAGKGELMRNNYKEMYAALRASFPLEQCWPELR